MTVARRRIRRLTLACLLAGLLSLLALAPAAGAETGGARALEEPGVGRHSPFVRQGMWIWYLDQSQGGSTAAILANAHRHHIGTVYVKSGDGTDYWSQFSRTLVRELHHGGLKVCAWQFVYGDAPAAEAKVAAEAVAAGADCFVIDAEAEYEGKYAAAELYVSRLRAAVGAGFPLSLASFPYVDYHPAFPYSVFLGPGGATVNQPQMYWKAIGTSVGAVFEHTYLYNRLWGAPIFPIGQTYEAPSRAALRLFRRYSASYGTAPSWWDWQETTTAGWRALGTRAAMRPLPGFVPAVEHPLLAMKSKGDLVVWAQEHLAGAGEDVEVNGIFERATRRAVRLFQEAHGLPVDGRIDTDTWAKLLDYEPITVDWGAEAPVATSLRGGWRAPARVLGAEATSAKPGSRHSADAARLRIAAPNRPLSASLPPVRDELAGAPSRSGTP